MKPTKIYKTPVDEFSSYARDHILDKKSLEGLRKLYDEWQDAREKALGAKQISDSAKEGIKLSPDGMTPMLCEENLKLFDIEDQCKSLLKKEEDALKSLQAFLSELPKAPYDRYRLRDNFRNCLEITGIPLGELEIEGGISRGGFSRWEKSIMTSELPPSFLLTAAEKFGISLKELLYGDVTEERFGDNGIRKFIDDLTNLTNEEEMNWKTIEPQNEEALLHGYNKAMMHKAGDDVFANSLFDYGDFCDDNLNECADACCADVPGGQDVVVVFNLIKKGSGELFTELYIKPEGQDIEPLYSTLNGNNGTNELLGELIEAISNSLERIRVSQGARDVMDRVARLVNRPSAGRYVNRPSVGRLVNGGGCADEE